MDICDRCQSRELDFLFVDLKHAQRDLWIKDIPGFRCRDCGEILVSMGVIETVDEIIQSSNTSSMFPMLKYQQKVMKASGLERMISERYLHSWDMIRHDGRENWDVGGFRLFGPFRTLAAI
jgi:hypothetical protein